MNLDKRRRKPPFILAGQTILDWRKQEKIKAVTLKLTINV